MFHTLKRTKVSIDVTHTLANYTTTVTSGTYEWSLKQSKTTQPEYEYVNVISLTHSQFFHNLRTHKVKLKEVLKKKPMKVNNGYHIMKSIDFGSFSKVYTANEDYELTPQVAKVTHTNLTLIALLAWHNAKLQMISSELISKVMNESNRNKSLILLDDMDNSKPIIVLGDLGTGKTSIAKMNNALQSINLFAKLTNTVDASFSFDALLTKVHDYKTKLLMKIIRLSVAAAFKDNDIIRFWGEMVRAKETLTDRWVNDVKNIQGINRQLNFAFSRYSEAMYFKNKKSTILATQNAEKEIQLFNATQ